VVKIVEESVRRGQPNGRGFRCIDLTGVTLRYRFARGPGGGASAADLRTNAWGKPLQSKGLLPDALPGGETHFHPSCLGLKRDNVVYAEGVDFWPFPDIFVDILLSRFS